MSGLNKIIDEIMREAERQADEIINSAKEKAEEILAKGSEERTAWKTQFEEAVKQECERIVERTAFSDRQNRRQSFLKVRNKMIEEVIAEAKSKIENLSDNEYFEILFRLFEKNAQPMDGYICFASVDYGRIPDGFIERCNGVFPNNFLKLSSETESIHAGFIIKYGNIEENCSIDSVFESNRHVFRDKVNECLMSEE